MAKKKRASAKKNRRSSKEAKPLNVRQVVDNADCAMEALDMDRALSLYKAAVAMLKGQVELNVAAPQDASSSSSLSLKDPIILLARVLLKLGEVKVALDDQDGARNDFTSALALLKDHHDTSSDNDDTGSTLETHETRASLCLYLGQLSSETEALVAVRRGIHELEACVRWRERQLEHTKGRMETDEAEKEDGPLSTVKESLEETRRQLSAAFCTVAELFLTDLCFEQDAEQHCEAAVLDALKIKDARDGEPYVDALQCMSSLRLSQGRAQEAAKYMLQAYSKMKRGCEALSALVGITKDHDEHAATSTSTQAAELTDVDAANTLPDFDFRCQSAKLLMECSTVLKVEQENTCVVPDQVVECGDAAVQVLASLLAENDEVIEVWYLMGCAHAALTPPDLDTAAQYWVRTFELLSKVKDGLEIGAGREEDEEDQLNDISSQIDEVRQRLKEIGHDMNTANADDVEMNS